MSDFPKFSDQVRCPVDHSHVLMRGRAMTHIVRCRAAQANLERKRISLDINFSEPQRAAGSGTYPSVFPAFESDELWEDDIPTYQPIVPERAGRSHLGDPSLGINFSEPRAAGSFHCPPVFEAFQGDEIWNENVPTYRANVTERPYFVVRLKSGLRRQNRKIFIKSERKRFAVLENRKV